jgi:hypothetical protein
VDVGTQQYSILDRVGIRAEIGRNVSGFQKKDHGTARDRTAAAIRLEQLVPELSLSAALDDFAQDTRARVLQAGRIERLVGLRFEVFDLFSIRPVIVGLSMKLALQIFLIVAEGGSVHALPRPVPIDEFGRSAQTLDQDGQFLHIRDVGNRFRRQSVPDRPVGQTALDRAEVVIGRLLG